MKLKDSID